MFKRVKQTGGDFGVNVEEWEKKLRGEDDETIKQILDEYLEEKKG